MRADKPRVVRLRFEFTPEEWEKLRERFTDEDLRITMVHSALDGLWKSYNLQMKSSDIRRLQ